MIEIRALGAPFGAEVTGAEAAGPLDEITCAQLRDAFDHYGLLVFRDLDIDHAAQVWLTRMLIGKENEADDPSSGRPPAQDTWYISNRREASAAPYGRLQFHSDAMWAAEPFEVLSLYGLEVAQPAVPTYFVSAVHAWRTLPDDLRDRVAALHALHTSAGVRRGDLTNLVTLTVERPPTTVKPLVLTHPRTGDSILYACEQMTQEISDVAPDESEPLLERLFDHMYDPVARVEHKWRERDLVVWDNLAVQHARPNVDNEGPARTLRKVGHPMPRLEREEIPIYGDAR